MKVGGGPIFPQQTEEKSNKSQTTEITIRAKKIQIATSTDLVFQCG